MKKIVSFLMVIMLLTSFLSTNSAVSAAFYSKTISDTTTLNNILNIVKQNDGENCYNKMYYIFYNSQYAAAYNKNFPYSNSGSSYNYVMDNGTKYTLSGSSRGCYLYADYVSQYVYGISSHSNKCVTVHINQTAGSMTVEQLKTAIMTYAQAGEHIRIDNTHSVAFVAYDTDGFYYTDYLSDSYPKIYVHYTTWSNFVNECNAKSKKAMIYDIDRSTNSTTTTTTINAPTNDYANTITDTNAILWAKVNKPVGQTVTKIGIRVRKDGSTYDKGWSKYEAPSKSYNSDSKMYPYYNMNDELNLTLTHATKYYYQFYAVVGGTEYWSSEASFTTTGYHTYGAWKTTSNATCTSAGSQTRSCSCGKTETKTINALGHNYSNEWTIDKAATCTTAGSKSYHCTRCSVKSSVTEILATGHSWGSWRTVEKATCTKSGKQERTCSKCNTSTTNTIVATGHKYSDFIIDEAATCTKAGTKSRHCSECSVKSNVTTIKATGHNWGEFEVVQQPTTEQAGLSKRICKNNCGAEETKTLPKLSTDGHIHSFGEWKITKEATCTENGIQERLCTVCNEVESSSISMKGHTFGEWSSIDENGNIYRECSLCGEKENQYVGIINDESDESLIIEKVESAEAVEDTVSTNESLPEPKNEKDNKLIYIIVALAAVLTVITIVASIIIIKLRKKQI